MNNQKLINEAFDADEKEIQARLEMDEHELAATFTHETYSPSWSTFAGETK